MLQSKITDLTLVVIFGPVVYFALFGPILCCLLSALRLQKQDYGIADGDASKTNLKPALNLFYCVSLAHSAICLLCMTIEDEFEYGFVNIVSQHHGFSPKILGEYLRITKQMCLSNPASTMSWNLITYSAGLLDSQLLEDNVSGARALTMLIDQDTPVPITWLLIRSPRQRIQKLIGTLAWRSPAEQEMRWFAARIVEHLAGHLNLAHFPGALECISSLFDTSCYGNADQKALPLPFVIEHSKQRRRILQHKILVHVLKVLDRTRVPLFRTSAIPGALLVLISNIDRILEPDSKQRESGENLVLPGLRILENLAHDRHNCSLIFNTKFLISKIVEPVSSEEFVQDIKSSSAWTKIVDGSLRVVSRLMGSSGSTGQKMRRLIANNTNSVKNLEVVLNMDIIELQMQAIEVLTQLALHHPASTSATKRTEKLIERALHIFLTADWVEDYLKDEKRKTNEPTPVQQGTLSTLSMGTRVDNLINVANGARTTERVAQQAAEARVEKKMKEAQETASKLKEKAGEALALLSSDSEALKSFTGCDDDVKRLTELLDSNIKTIKCEISTTDIVEMEINIGCRISAAVILRHLSNYVKAPTLRKVLLELLPEQVEASSTPRFWESLFPICRRNDIENQSDRHQEESSASQSHHIQQSDENRLQAELLSLITVVLVNSNFDFADILISPPASNTLLEDFVVRLKKMVEEIMYATPACLAIQKLTCEMVIGFLQHDQNVEVIDKHDIVGTLLEASKMTNELESSMLFAGVDRDCHGVPLKPLSSVLAKTVEDLLTQRKQALGINIVPASVSAMQP